MGIFFGLDIGLSQVKVMQAAKESGKFKLLHFAAVKYGPNQLVEAVKQAIKLAGIKNSAEANIALKESDVYSRIIETPKLSETELASSIQFEAEQYIPTDLSEIDLSYQIIGGLEDALADKKTMKVLLIATPKEKLTSLTNLIDEAGLIPMSVETELLSLKRLFGQPKKLQLLMLFGYKTTDMIILNNGVPQFLYSMPTGGLALTRVLTAELQLPEDQAEQYKRTYGLLPDQLEGKVAKLLTPLIDEMVKEINKSFVFLQQQGWHVPDQLILTGGGAMLPGLSGYLVQKLNLEVLLGDPFENFIKDENFTGMMNGINNTQLAVVTGLAIKGLV
ncbi:MAG: type IV pilus assembly protein PilM [Patescibacteria group bacterium]